MKKGRDVPDIMISWRGMRVRTSFVKIFIEEFHNAVERDDVHAVIQVGVTCAGNDYKFLVVSFKKCESILAEIERMCLIAMNYYHGIFQLIGIFKELEIEER